MHKWYSYWMASITQYRGKTWRAIIRRAGFPPRSQTFANKKDAETWAADIESKMGVSQYDALQLKQAKLATVATLFDRYIAEVAPGMKGKNALTILKRLRRDASFMRIRLDRITPNDIRDWRDSRVQEIQPQSVHREWNSLSGVFTHAIKEWNAPLAANPCKLVARFKNADKVRKGMWSPEDTALFLKTCGWTEDSAPKTGRDYVGWALLLGIATAMRIGEMCLPKVSDFHPEGRYLHLLDTKNGDERDVPLSLLALGYLTHLCQGKEKGDKIIPINANTLGEYVLDVRRQCGLEHLHFHDSRREAATRMSKKLSNVLELSAQTGHRSLKSLQVYYRPVPADIASKLD